MLYTVRLKMMRIEPKHRNKFVLCRDCLDLHKLNSKIRGMPCHSLSVSKHSSDRGAGD